MSETPTVSLNFYSFGLTLRKVEDDGTITEYPIDPEAAATALAAKITLTTGLLRGDTLYVKQEGADRIVVAYRKPQMTGLFLEGRVSALRVPLPGLVMLRRTQDNTRPHYTVYAVKQRPRTLTGPLYHSPLPNVYTSGNICWGSVAQAPALDATDLTADFGQLLGSAFGSHAVNRKSKAHPGDVRELLRALDEGKKTRYPTSDLRRADTTLAKLLGVDA